MCLAGSDPTGCSQRPWLSPEHGRSKCLWLGPCSWQPPGSGLLNASNQTASPEGFLPPQSEIIKVGKEIQHLVKSKACYHGKASLPPQRQARLQNLGSMSWRLLQGELQPSRTPWQLQCQHPDTPVTITSPQKWTSKAS